MKTLRICLDAVPLIYSQGADFRTTLNLYRELLRIGGHEYRLLCVSRCISERTFEPLRKAGSFSLHKVRMPFRLMNWAWRKLGWPNVEQLVGDVDIYHGTSIYAPAAKRAKVLITFRGIVAEIIPEKLPPDRVKALKRVVREALPRADYFIAVSEATAKDLVQYLHLDENRVYVIPHGVDPVFRVLGNRQKLRRRLQNRFSLHAPYILYVGAIGIHKNVLGLLDAYQRLHAQKSFEHHLCLVGKPDSAWKEVKAFIKEHHLASYVHHIGWIPPHSSDLVDLYNGASCCVFPSFYEGWCSPPLESMACGTPVVVANVPSLRETTGGAALLVDPYDPESIADGIRRTLEDQELRQTLIQRGEAHAARMNWRRAAKRALEVYKIVATEKV